MPEYTYPPPPPPPPPTAGLSAERFQLPGTNLFLSIRRQLSSLERPAQFKAGRGPVLGFLAVFIVAGLLRIPWGLIDQYAIVPGLGPSGSLWVSWLFIAPLVRGIFILLAILVVGYFVLGAVPNRRYGVALGVFAGIGYGVFGIIYLAAVQRESADPLWYLMIPIWTLILSTFLGICGFALVAKAPSGKVFLNAILGLPLLLFIIFMVMELVFEGMGTLISGPYWGARYLILPLFLFILRDFLGGHFNFQHFFETTQESPASQPDIPPPPPP
jgi:hypothetical protein